MDFYVILGLEQNASPADIKRAYTRLARRFHPGINPGDPAAQSLFQRISEAYETLSDPERRRAYDTGGATVRSGGPTTAFEFSGFDFSIAARGAEAATFSELFAEVLHPTPAADSGRPEVGPDVHALLSLSFEDSIRGVERQVVVTRHVACSACAGAGQVRTPEGRCPRCQGAGTVRWARGHMVFSKACVTCAGTGRQRVQRCEICAGHGRSVRSEAISVQVPAGVSDGVRLRVPEKGHAGRRGGRTGDLYVDITVQPHPLLRRDGNDLSMTVPVAVHEAVLGARIDLPSLDGTVKVTIPPGTQAGRLIRLAGRGAPTAGGGRGDLIVEVRLVLPAAVDERSRDLMREFGRLNSEDVRRDLQV